jgi:hypothetical protein
VRAGRLVVHQAAPARQESAIVDLQPKFVIPANAGIQLS